MNALVFILLTNQSGAATPVTAMSIMVMMMHTIIYWLIHGVL
jgi:hypothetical protein